MSLNTTLLSWVVPRDISSALPGVSEQEDHSEATGIKGRKHPPLGWRVGLLKATTIPLGVIEAEMVLEKGIPLG